MFIRQLSLMFIRGYKMIYPVAVQISNRTNEIVYTHKFSLMHPSDKYFPSKEELLKRAKDFINENKYRLTTLELRYLSETEYNKI